MIAESDAEMRTSVLLARKGSTSLKTTIPETYVNMLKLKVGDSLDWDHVIENNEIIVRVRRAKGIK